jgi:hypothetical protein
VNKHFSVGSSKQNLPSHRSHLASLLVTSVFFLFGLQHAFGGSLLYIYSHTSSDDSVKAVQFKSFFDSLGHTTTLVKTNQFAGLNLAQYGLLIISSGSGSGLGWDGDAASVTAIKNSGKPILAMGYGGPNLFDSLDLWCGWGQSAGGTGGGEVITDKSHSIFTAPAEVVIPGNGALVIDLAGTSGEALYIGGTPPADVILFGRCIGASDYAALALEKGKYFYWGYATPVTDISAPAKQLLANIVYFLTVTITEVSSRESGTEGSPPVGFALLQNYPNPFNPRTVIRYQSSVTSNVRLSVYDMLGREVAVLVDERKEPGSYRVAFDGTALASGVYICRLTAAGFVQSQKMLLTK